MNITVIDVLLTALLSIFGTLYLTQSKGIDKNITEQRKNWRDYLRDKISELSSVDLRRYDAYSKIYVIKNDFYVRINPYRDKPIIDKFDELLKIIKNTNNENYIHEGQSIIDEITEMTSKLLKHDWERVKNHQNFFESPYRNERIINILILLFGTYLIYIFGVPKLKIDGVTTEYLDFLDPNIMLLLFVFVLIMKIINKILCSSLIYRNKSKNNINIFSEEYKKKIQSFMENDLK